MSSNLAVFETVLPRHQITKIWDSHGPEESPLAKKLQDLFDQGLNEQYDLELKSMKETGAKFRLTDGKVFQIIDSNNTLSVKIKFQVKGGTLTWYILAPKDQTHQSFRDEVYAAAGLAHHEVTDHCEKYWRGTNSLHVKLMHTKEEEAGFNHNHYRMKDCDADPQAVYEHLLGFVKAQKELDLIDAEGKEKFLTKEEALQIYKSFEKFWIVSHHAGPEKTIKLYDEFIHLPAKDVSDVDAYKKSPEQVFTLEDVEEWETNKHKQDPCTTDYEDWDKFTISQRLALISAGMRGLGAELAQTRQVAGSAYATHSTVVAKDDLVVVS